MLTQISQAIKRKNAYFLATIFGGAFLAEIVIDSGVNKLWELNNRGVAEYNLVA